MEDQYAIADLRQYISSRPLFPAAVPQPPSELLSGHRGLNHPANPYDMLMFRTDSTTSVATPTNNGGASGSAAAGGCYNGFDGGINGGSGDGGTGRWPRQETLTLLEIRSRLDPKFKEANQKGPLWDEVSRIMSEEHGYQRSGKKCREKFENLYKYYKKTKEGKAGRQDGKHYRFFRQLEALYGENSNNNSASNSEAHLMGGNFHYNYPNNKNTSSANIHEAFQCPKFSDTSLSLSNYSDADTSSSDNSDNPKEGNDETDSKSKKRRSRRGWKVKIKEFIDAHMKKLMDKQEAWMEKMMRTIENKEQERMMREEEWRKQDAARIEREHKFWASERAWIEARDSALMDALHKITGKDLPLDEMMEPEIRSLSENHNEDGSHETMAINSAKGDIWPESEIAKLIQLRTSLEVKFQQRGNMSEDIHLWDEIANKMACFGYDRSGLMCKEKWDSINNYLLKCSKKRKENSSKSCNYNYQATAHHHYESISNHQGGVYCDANDQQGIRDHNTVIRLNVHDDGHSSPNSNSASANAAVNDSCFRYFMGDGYGRIMD